MRKSGIINKILTFEDACTLLKINAEHVINADDPKDEAAYKKLKIIAQALNESWKPDWNNSSEYKYYPWFRMDSGFSLFSVNLFGSYSTVGSRLCFRTEALAEYAATQFVDLYNDFFNF